MPIVYDDVDMTPLANIGQRIRSLRASRGWSVARLARETEMTEGAIYKIEGNPNAQPTPDTITALARVLTVSADELLGLEPNGKLTGLIEIPPGDWVTIPMLTTAAGMDTGEEISVPSLCLPDGVDHDRLAALVVADDACAPDLCHDDLAILARDQPWSDGDLIVVPIDGQLLVRRGYQEVTDVMLVGADLSDRRRLPRDQVVGRIMSCLHHF